MSPASITKIRSDREARARRHIELARLLRDAPDATNIELAKSLHVSRNTIAEDRKHLMNIVSGEAKTEMVIYREQQLAELVDLRDVLSDPKIKPDRKVELTLAIIDREMRLTGTAAPTRSIQATINADVDPAKLVGYRKFLYHTRHLSEEDVNRLVFPFCDSLPPSHEPNPLLGEVVTDEKL
ncbi:MAG TPA: hypothetical protein VJP02_16615 [Candidatus Sulfotelmatobacter sp.]|nr:hypothetical protein [Candidatus Sulfotelmatobacter sp.]